MNPSGNLWVVVLAGGSGSRLAPLSTGADGAHVPKQFCRFGGSASMLQRTLERARSLAPASRVLPVVLEAYRPWWEPEMARIPEENQVVQPLNRGTGFAILHALTVVLQRDPTARMLVMPSDHAVRDELVLRRAMADLTRRSQEDPDDVLLLGALPDRAETSYGWIVRSPGSGLRVASVASLIDKPHAGEAERLLRAGAMWSTLIFAASVAAVWRLYGAAQPAWLERFVWSMHGGDDPEGMLDVYGRLPHLDFGQDVLAAAADHLRVMPMAPCGWTDLGTPERVSAWITASASRPPVDHRMAQGA
jgi:mannose-1-phosphate guanylyltransferase